MTTAQLVFFHFDYDPPHIYKEVAPILPQDSRLAISLRTLPTTTARTIARTIAGTIARATILAISLAEPSQEHQIPNKHTHGNAPKKTCTTPIHLHILDQTLFVFICDIPATMNIFAFVILFISFVSAVLAQVLHCTNFCVEPACFDFKVLCSTHITSVRVYHGSLPAAWNKGGFVATCYAVTASYKIESSPVCCSSGSKVYSYYGADCSGFKSNWNIFVHYFIRFRSLN